MMMGKKVIKSADIAAKAGHEPKLTDLPPRERATALVQELGGVVNKRVLDARQQAEEVLAHADQEAFRIREDAERILHDIERAHAEAKERGFAEGRDEGLASVTDSLLALERMKEEFFEKAEPEIIKLILQCIEKTFGRVAEESSSVAIDVVRQAIQASIGDRIVISVSPHDYAVIMAAESELRGLLDRTKRVHFKEDESISAGGCVLETEIGTIDARLETQLKALRKAFDL